MSSSINYARGGTNRKIGSIEHVGSDGFIVESADPHDPDFYGGKRLFRNFDDLLRFLADHLQVFKESGASYGIKPPVEEDSNIELSPAVNSGSNGTPPRPLLKEANPVSRPRIQRERV